MIQSPWHTDIHRAINRDESRQHKEFDEEKSPMPQLRRSTREQKTNPRYVNAALVEVKEPLTYEKAS